MQALHTITTIKCLCKPDFVHLFLCLSFVHLNSNTPLLHTAESVWCEKRVRTTCKNAGSLFLQSQSIPFQTNKWRQSIEFEIRLKPISNIGITNSFKGSLDRHFAKSSTSSRLCGLFCFDRIHHTNLEEWWQWNRNCNMSIGQDICWSARQYQVLSSFLSSFFALSLLLYFTSAQCLFIDHQNICFII